MLRSPPSTVSGISCCYGNHWLCFRSALSIVLVGNGEKRTKLAKKMEEERQNSLRTVCYLMSVCDLEEQLLDTVSRLSLSH